ncbi:MAG: T9SS type A sorting domain-containing protein, partial [Flavobacteriales bacterium]|nr:T9SS type A sorting domain-containing protein [Flavobacteriales bacterium]
TWYQVQTGEIEDMEYHPTDPTIIYANGHTFYRSIDGGENFEASNEGLPSSSDVSRYSTAVSPDEPDWVYLLAGDADTQGFLGIYRSTDQGQTWTLRADSPNLMGWSGEGTDTGGQAWYDIAVEVDPDNADRVFVGGVNLWRSNTGGSSWSIRAHWVYPSFTGAYVHADIHDLKYIGNRLYCLSDGGIFVSNSDGTAFTDLTEGLTITQFYRLGSSVTNSSLILAGAQDNGMLRTLNGSWGQIYGADGMECLVHPTNTSRYFISSQYGNIRRTNNGGDSFTNWVEGIPESGAWVTPFMLDPNDPNTLFAGYESLWKRTGNGAWFQLSPPSGNITQFNIAPSNSDVIYIVRSTTVLKTTDGGDTWSGISVGGSSTTKTSIAFNPEDENEVYITVSGFNIGSKVYRTTDGGDNWENISYNLPNFPANSIVYEAGSNGGLYVAMDVGIYYINDDLVNWIPYEEGLPKVPVSELEIHYATNKLRAATYGRGLWESDLFTGLTEPPAADFIVSKEMACVGEELTFTDFSINHSPGWQWVFEGGSPATSTEQNPQVTYANAGTYDVSLMVDNGVGSDMEMKSEFITILSDVGEEMPFTEGFETIVDLEVSDRWSIENLDNDMTWEVNTSVGNGSPSCVWINNYNNAFDRKDRLFSTTIDMSGAEEMELTMDVAFAQIDEDDKDKLRVYSSTDCGNDWDLKKSFSGHTTLHSVDPMTEEFFPSGPEEWHTLVVDNLDSDDAVEGFRFYLYFENDGGNNIFIDNINLSFIVSGVEDLDIKNLDMQIFPNPSAGNSALEFFLLGDREVGLSIYDISGRAIDNMDLGSLGFGPHRFDLEMDLGSGVYLVELSVDGKSETIRWFID